MANLECPNCGASQISEKWVEQSRAKENRTTFDEHAKDKLQHPPNQGYIICDILTFATYIQYILSCDKCGYTKVYEVDGGEGSASR